MIPSLSDCTDESDETNCNISCTAGQFACGGHNASSSNTSSSSVSVCVSESWLCDGDADCPDGADEAEELCAARPCPPEKFRCGDHVCVPQGSVCDGVQNCADGADEAHALCKNRSV